MVQEPWPATKQCKEKEKKSPFFVRSFLFSARVHGTVVDKKNDVCEPFPALSAKNEISRVSHVLANVQVSRYRTTTSMHATPPAPTACCQIKA